MSEKILERCPCCGDGWFAFCMNRSCGCRSGIFPTKPMARNAWNTRASSPAHEPVTTEPVAWTNEAQLGFLKEPGYRVVPMAMWAFQHSAHPIALYLDPAPPEPGREWLPIETAPKDGTPVLVKLKDVIPNDREDLRRWNGLAFVARSHGDVMEWGFAAPVGHGGFPDEWMAGWMPLPALTGEPK